jgi:hypothetical protein
MWGLYWASVGVQTEFAAYLIEGEVEVIVVMGDGNEVYFVVHDGIDGNFEAFTHLIELISGWFKFTAFDLRNRAL